MKLSHTSYLIARSSSSLKRGFTIVELMVSIGIFAMMTALVVAKYGNFNGSVLLTNLAYDVAVTLRTAQTYGLSVKNSDEGNITSDFKNGYGVHFDTRGSVNNQMIFFADRDGDNKYSDASENVSVYTLKRGAVISKLCVSVGCTGPGGQNNSKNLDVLFIRPDPKAIICLYNNKNDSCGPIDVSNLKAYIEIVIRGTDNSTRTVIVRENGQISVKE